MEGQEWMVRVGGLRSARKATVFRTRFHHQASPAGSDPANAPPPPPGFLPKKKKRVVIRAAGHGLVFQQVYDCCLGLLQPACHQSAG